MMDTTTIDLGDEMKRTGNWGNPGADWFNHWLEIGFRAKTNGDLLRERVAMCGIVTGAGEDWERVSAYAERLAMIDRILRERRIAA